MSQDAKSEIVNTLSEFSEKAYEKYSHMLDDLGLT
jgi:hypothetical protein